MNQFKLIDLYSWNICCCNVFAKLQTSSSLFHSDERKNMKSDFSPYIFCQLFKSDIYMLWIFNVLVDICLWHIKSEYRLIFISMFQFRHLCKCLLTAPLLLGKKKTIWSSSNLFASIQLFLYSGCCLLKCFLSATLVLQNGKMVKWWSEEVKWKWKMLLLVMRHLLP